MESFTCIFKNKYKDNALRVLIDYRGVYFLVIGWLGKKYDDLLRKKRKYEGEEMEKWAKSGNFSLYLGEKYHFEEVGGGAKYRTLQI